MDGTDSLIIEWAPPKKNFDEIQVHCPSSYTTFQYFQTMPIMFVKCIVTNGIQFNVTFATVKSGYQWGILQFTDTRTSTREFRTHKNKCFVLLLVESTTTTTVTTTPPTTTTATSTPPTTTGTSTPSVRPPGVLTPSTTLSQRPLPIITSSCSQDECAETQAALTRWRTAAIIALIVVGFLLLATICLTIFFVRLFLQNRYDNTDE